MIDALYRWIDRHTAAWFFIGGCLYGAALALWAAILIGTA